METAELIILILSGFFVFGAFATYLKVSDWWVRVFDFPRLQISVMLIACIIAGIAVYSFTEIWHVAILVACFGALIFELVRIYLYTPFSKKQVMTYTGKDDQNSISLLVSNVLQTNRNSDKLIQLVKKYDPDILLTLETNKWWEKQLEKIEPEMPHTIKKSQKNLYGMHLYSKAELKNTSIKHLVKPNIPSFETEVMLNSKKSIKMYCLHPRPPFPTESDTSLFRDAELLIVGKKVEKTDEPVIVCGDFNDVAWSRTTRLFQKVSELLDPRIGRGFFNSFHAKIPFMRFPLDHVFHSDHFKLVKMKRLSSIGSDHFPIYIKLYYDSSFERRQEEPDADGEEQKYASEIISEANSKE